jgi:hypothetical protein
LEAPHLIWEINSSVASQKFLFELPESWGTDSLDC